jgi:hypothetical protein
MAKRKLALLLGPKLQGLRDEAEAALSGPNDLAAKRCLRFFERVEGQWMVGDYAKVLDLVFDQGHRAGFASAVNSHRRLIDRAFKQVDDLERARGKRTTQVGAYQTEIFKAASRMKSQTKLSWSKVAAQLAAELKTLPGNHRIILRLSGKRPSARTIRRICKK